MKQPKTIQRDGILPNTTAIRWLLLPLVALLLLAGMPAQAATAYNFSIDGRGLPTGCSLDASSTDAYTCGALTLVDGDTITVTPVTGTPGTPATPARPVTVTFTGAFTTAPSNEINAAGATSDLNLITQAALTLGADTILNAHVTGTAAINMGAGSTVRGNLTASTTTGVVTLAVNSTVGGFIHTIEGAVNVNGSNTIGGDIATHAGVVTLLEDITVSGGISTVAGGINIGDRSKIGGDIVTEAGVVVLLEDITVGGGISTIAGGINIGDRSTIGGDIVTEAGVVVLLEDITVDGGISTVAGGITIGDHSSTCGNVISTGAGVVTLTTNIHIGGDVSTVAGAITIGSGSKVGGNISPTGAGVVTLTGVQVGGNVATGAGAVTATNSFFGGNVDISGAGVLILTGVEVGGYVATNTGSLTLTDSHVGGSVTSSAAITLSGSSSTNDTNVSVAELPVSPACASVTPAVDHYQIIHDGQGLTCNPETVTIKACTNEYDGSCTLSDEAVTLDVTAEGDSGSVTATISFTGLGTASIPYRFAELATLLLANASIAAANPTVCFDGSNVSCDLVFAESGFFLEIDNHISGKEIEASILAVKTGEEDPGQCVPAFTGEKNIEFTTEYQNPATGTLAVESGGDLLNGYSLTLDFDDSGAASFPIQYKDVGRVVLKARYEGTDEDEDEDEDEDAKLVMLGEGTFVARPDHFELATIPRNPEATSVQDDNVFVAAGANFEVRVSSINNLGDVTPNFGRETPAESVQLKTALVAPADGDSPPLAGTFGAFGEDCSGNATSGGTACGQFQWPEVGIISIMPSLLSGNYLGTVDVAGDEVTHVGRFTPHHFTAQEKYVGDIGSACGASDGFTYSGQETGWAVGPTVKIIPRNVGGVETQNYRYGKFMRLKPSHVGVDKNSPKSDTSATLADGGAYPLKFVLETGVIVNQDGEDRVSGDDIFYHFSDDDTIWYVKSEKAQVGPFKPDLTFKVISIEDSDVQPENLEAPLDIKPHSDGDIYYGRLFMENAYGPETSELPVPMRVEYFKNKDSGFVINSNENCWTYNLKEDVTLDFGESTFGKGDGINVVDIEQSDLRLDGGQPRVDESEDKDYRIRLTPPGASKMGKPDKRGIKITLDTGNDWLKDYWDADNPNTRVDPYAWATFGVYRGNDRIIYWREVFTN
ncbi:DUF6701 domain-containing protein [Marinobacter gelidimuriae]|uniref:DUF6701 domain-containing protein n=1 Tax=Marinobacter gelidimuriae TaxID=2739064 RepID=UPI0003632E3A|nr:DUF6701 domain-containing protein [Marinobacter gelidimuriae]